MIGHSCGNLFSREFSLRIGRIIIGMIIVFSAIVCLGLWFIARQGVYESEYASRFGERVDFDPQAIPTIKTNSLLESYQIEGFIVASERLWQMDLSRRSAVGRLAEIFGDKAVLSDIERRQLGVEDVLTRAVELLPLDQRRVCDSYAQGVNQFIDDFSWRWGIEFLVLGYRPEPWSCKDSLAVLMVMAEDLGGSSKREMNQWEWRKRIPEAWTNIIYTDNHPWNRPLFGTAPESKNLVPPRDQWLKATKPRDIKVKDFHSGGLPVGSNSWVYRGKFGTFLANDPHLSQRVPQVWYAMRKFFDTTEKWIAGVGVPGLPGIVIGMNQDIAWGFTNTGEDVDDLTIEEISNDGQRFLRSSLDGKELWEPINQREFEVRSSDGTKRKGLYRSTDLGPIISELPGSPKRGISRRWLGLDPNYLRIPTSQLGASTNWAEFNTGVDEITIPSQNIVFGDRSGQIGYRTSGRGIVRHSSSREPKQRSELSWQSVAPPPERKRLLRIPTDSSAPYIATANQRIWIDGISHDWSGDDRAHRIAEVLDQRHDLNVFDMQQLQHDTFSRFSLILLDWVMQNYEAPSTTLDERYERWRNWSGKIIDDSTVFQEAVFLETAFFNLLLSRIAHEFAQDVDLPKYQHFNRRAWLLATMGNEDLLRAFGFDPSQTAAYLVNELQNFDAKNIGPYSETNRWRTQHPFVGRIPFLGKMFRLQESPQSGSHQTIKVELPTFGASGRFVWSITDPGASVWAFPVGQSGHIRSLHFRDLQKDWTAGKYSDVFPPGHRPALKQLD